MWGRMASYGGLLTRPSLNRWLLATHVTNLPPHSQTDRSQYSSLYPGLAWGDAGVLLPGDKKQPDPAWLSL